MGLDFLKDIEKEFAKIEGIGVSAEPPRYWYSLGNHVLNYIMSGSFYNGVPQGRLTALCGPSGTGKSYIAANVMKAVQEVGGYNLVLDSENALDNAFVKKIGVDPTKNYTYTGPTTIIQVIKLISKFIKGYKLENDTNEDGPRVHITIDSLDMLLTDTELDNYKSGNAKGDQGQRAKQIKAMLRTLVQDIKGCNISILVTSQVYKNQDLKNGEGVWIVNDGIRYSLSQIILLTKLKLKDDKEVIGIKMRAESYKTRFSKPFQKVEIFVPYDTGMDPLSGLLEIAINQELVKQGGAWYTLNSTGEKFQKKNLSEYATKILEDFDKLKDVYMNVENEEEESDDNMVSNTKRRMDKVVSE